MTNQKEDPNKYPLHMRGDILTKNKNIDEGKELCKRCGGTGNEFFSMYHECQACGGTGVYNKKLGLW
ncbi:MAG: hypothetical protein ACOC1K_02580 [Nanoarchaeota archaeon]